MKGYVKLYRKMLEWEWMDEPVTVQVFVYCLLRANFETQRWHGVIIKPGQFVTSLSHMAKDLGISKSQLRTAIKHLILTQSIAQSVTQHATLITIEKWGDYQGAGEKAAQLMTQHMTSQSHLNRTSIATNKECKECKEGKEKRDIKRMPEKSIGLNGATVREPDTYTADETSSLMQAAHDTFAPIKAAIMKGAEA